MSEARPHHREDFPGPLVAAARPLAELGCYEIATPLSAFAKRFFLLRCHTFIKIFSSNLSTAILRTCLGERQLYAFRQVTHLRLCRTRMAAMTGLGMGRGCCLQHSWLVTTGPGSQ